MTNVCVCAREHVCVCVRAFRACVRVCVRPCVRGSVHVCCEMFNSFYYMLGDGDMLVLHLYSLQINVSVVVCCANGCVEEALVMTEVSFCFCKPVYSRSTEN